MTIRNVFVLALFVVTIFTSINVGLTARNLLHYKTLPVYNGLPNQALFSEPLAFSAPVLPQPKAPSLEITKPLLINPIPQPLDPKVEFPPTAALPTDPKDASPSTPTSKAKTIVTPIISKCKCKPPILSSNNIPNDKFPPIPTSQCGCKPPMSNSKTKEIIVPPIITSQCKCKPPMIPSLNTIPEDKYSPIPITQCGCKPPMSNLRSDPDFPYPPPKN
ncbi:hypothetical protein ACFE04_013283 [Oxalis oulophora]